MRKDLVLLAAVMMAGEAFAGRSVESLCGPGWTCDGEAISVPHTWNAADAADGSPVGAPPPARGMSISPDSYVRKAAVYVRALPDPTPGKRQFVRFDGVSRTAAVRINGRLAGIHRGAFTAFTVEATEFLNPSGNVLEVTADNRWDEDIAPLSGDYTLMGGIYRTVDWLETDPVCIDPVTDGADGVRLEADPKTGHVVAHVRVLGGTNEIQTFHFPEPKLWSPEEPNLYTVRVAIRRGDSEDAIDVRFGFRTIEFRADGFYLNGVRRKLRGVNRHQDAGLCGWAALPADEERDFRLIKELGADAVRLAHYPQSAHVYDLCDELGLLVWSEVPAINWLTDSEAFRANLEQQAREMVAQRGNHPCVFVWGLFNEIYNDAPADRAEEGWMEDILEDVRGVLDRADPSRPIVAATDRPAKRRLNGLPDQLAFNAYPGWYGDTTMTGDIAQWFASAGRPMLGIAEYGAGGNPFEHLDPLPSTRLDPGGPIHPEETHVRLLSANWRTILAEDRLWGTFVWAMFDFAADARREGGKNGINDKGLVTRDRATVKDAFWFFKANWSAEPVVHVCSKRMTETTNAVATVVGFSNRSAVELAVNGVTFGIQDPDEVKLVQWNDVPLTPGDNVIELRAGGLSDTRALRRK